LGEWQVTMLTAHYICRDTKLIRGNCIIGSNKNFYSVFFNL